ncbi:MAG: hypothetical protein IJR95_06840 [Lachnospiraceae bacterium]|nr:hypothetical protein [Lachnospiraceae bacterium]
MKKPPYPVIEVVIMAALTAVLFLQKQLLLFLPNVTLNFFLILLYAKVLGLGRTAAIVTVYLLLDSTLHGSLNPIFTTAQWIGWMWGPMITCTLLKNTENEITLAFANGGFALLYSWTMIVPTALIYTNQVKNLWAYFLVDLPWELMLVVSAFLPTLLLYPPVVKLLRRLWHERLG